MISDLGMLVEEIGRVPHDAAPAANMPKALSKYPRKIIFRMLLAVPIMNRII